MITIDRTLLLPDGMPPADLLLALLSEHRRQRETRLDLLKRYYDGDHAILSRARLSGLPNNRLAHALPAYITAISAGYLVGSPVQYSLPDHPAAFDQLLQALRRSDTQSIDAELAVDAAVYGKAVEICYADEQAKPCVAQVDPRRAFVVYDDTVEHRPLLGITVNDVLDKRLKKCRERITVCTDALIVHMERRANETPVETARTAHYFGGVPMTEYWNNASECGDFEAVLSLIDAYDTLQSDRVNDKQQFTDAIMVLKGVGALGAEDTETDFLAEDDPAAAAMEASRRLRHTRTLFLPGDGADAEFITKPDSESGSELLRKSLAGDIHKLSFVPDLTDVNFAGDLSGVAMRFKLLGFEQHTKIKERWFREALRTRLRRMAHFLRVQGAAEFDVDQIQITFKRSLPVNDLEIAKTVQAYQGIVPDEILLSQVPFVENAKDTAAMRSERG
ncbi:MAG TPA: phage portal protein [Candidatus Limiplasma sp.]|nr:phage portal protein [Candidatus Limiplasma sp.]